MGGDGIGGYGFEFGVDKNEDKEIEMEIRV
jgi:hypothetical protein